MTDVSIVLLNWNSGATVCDAAESALAQTGVKVELLIVDNGSTDGSLEELRRRFPTARFIELGSNTGFTGGMNAGTEAAHGEFVLWQNADLVLAEDYCRLGVDEMRADPTIGAVGGLVQRLVAGRRTDGLDASGYTLSALHRVVLVNRRATTHDVLGVSGSCPLIRRTALESLRAPVGYVLDPWYFAYGEDIDVMLRLNLLGCRVQYSPQAKAWHVRSASTAAASRFYEKPEHVQVHHFKNRLATIIKCYPWSVLLPRLPWLIAAELALPAYLLVRGRPLGLRAWVFGWRAVWSERKRLVRDRRAVQQLVSKNQIRRLKRLLRHA